MKSKEPTLPERVVGFIDIGTNSIRLLVVRINPNHSYTVLSRQKQQIRLGEGEYETNEILPEAIERTVVVCKKFVELGRTFSADEFVVVATSATREATNQHELLERLQREAKIDVRVVSGLEEARLIYLGVSGVVHLGTKNALFIDIGGGSTEIAVGGEREYHLLDSFKLGAIRLTNHCFSGVRSDPVPLLRYKDAQRYVKNEIVQSVQRIRAQKPTCAIGSSGTIENLAEIAAKTFHPNKKMDGNTLSYRDLRKVIELLCALPLEERRKVPGMNPERADIIIAGAAILEIFLKELSLKMITVTSRGLQDGLLADYLSRREGFSHVGELSIRERSVLQLGRACGINEVHARTVTGLALELFDSARDLKLHAFGNWERELLKYATFLHDIGSFIAFSNHHAHSYYMIKNSELLGFDQKEISIMANLARFHRKKLPGKKSRDLAELDPHGREVVRVLSMFLRLGESLDRSHAALIQHAGFSKLEKNAVVLSLVGRGDCQLECWGLENERPAFEKVFHRKLLSEIADADRKG
ncbi:MAG: Ppx/GppA phosphatase family protein [Methanoregula sp.]|nr:Ppx/GppA phosphatase family protein [Methanoregula sp.]